MTGLKPTGTLQVAEQPGVPKERQLAGLALDPLAGGAAIAATFSKGMFGATDVGAAHDVLLDRAKAIRSSKLGSVEDMLTGQAAALHAIFLELTRRSGANMGEYIQAAETYMRLALKAQAQCRATLETLATIKNPPVVYARQANIAAGPQQVNNRGGATHAGETASAPNELLEVTHEQTERLEPGAADTAISFDPAMETLGAIDGTADSRGQSTGQPQRRQGRKAVRAQG